MNHLKLLFLEVKILPSLPSFIYACSSCLITVTPPVYFFAECLLCVGWFFFFPLEESDFLALKGNSSWVIRQPFNGKGRLPHFPGSCSPNWSLGDVQLSSARSCVAFLLHKCSDGSCERGTGWLTSFPGTSCQEIFFLFILKTGVVLAWHFLCWKNILLNSSYMLGELTAPKTGFWELAMSLWSPGQRFQKTLWKIWNV